MTKLKSDKEYIKIFNELSWRNPNEKDSELSKLIRSIQQNAIEAALEIAAKEGKVRREENTDDGDYFEISPLSITSLINHKDLKV